VRGIRVWPLVRLSLYATTFNARISEHFLGGGTRRRLAVVSEAIGSWARARVRDRRANRRATARADAVFLAYSVGRQPVVEGRRYNPLAAPYVELVARQGRRSLVWEMSPFGEYNLPRYTPSFLIQPWLVALRILSEILPLGREEIVLPEYQRFVAAAREAGLPLRHADLRRLRRDALFIRRLADKFTHWLRRATPSLGFVADGGPREMAFCLACRELGITSVEIQHGIVTDLHPIYGSWHAVPADGYETRPRLFWTWDQPSAAVLECWTRKAPTAHGVVVGGDPWRDMWARADSELVRRAHAGIETRKQEIGGERHILVTLDSNRELLPGSLRKAIADGPSEWRWWVRLHPVHQAARRAEAVRELPGLGLGTELMDYASGLPLHALLRHMDAHATVGLSSVVAEAAEAGVPSVACLAEAADFYAGEVARGTLRVGGTGAEILQALEQAFRQGRPVPTASRPEADAAMKQVLATRAFARGE
ncbi:MAG: hypothetical protein ACREMX_04080, partial [Gemmatimonadales bacterium]